MVYEERRTNMGVILNVMILAEIRRHRKEAIEDGLRRGQFHAVRRGRVGSRLVSGAHYRPHHELVAAEKEVAAPK